MQFTELLRKVTIKNNYTLGTTGTAFPFAKIYKKKISQYHKLIDEDG